MEIVTQDNTKTRSIFLDPRRWFHNPKTNRFEQKDADDIAVLFGENALKQGEHGALVGTWLRDGYTQRITIAFFYPGRYEAPALTPSVLENLFRRARIEGIEPSHIYSFGNVVSARSYLRK